MIPELSFLSVSSLLRFNGYNKVANNLFTVFYPLYNLVTAPIFGLLLNMKTYGLVLSFSTGKLFTVLLAIYYLFTLEWKPHEEDASNSEIELKPVH